VYIVCQFLLYTTIPRVRFKTRNVCEIPRHPDVILKASFRLHLDIISHINSKTEIKGKPSVVTLVLRNYCGYSDLLYRHQKCVHPYVMEYNIYVQVMYTNNTVYMYMYIRFPQWTVNGVFLSFLCKKKKKHSKCDILIMIRT